MENKDNKKKFSDWIVALDKFLQESDRLWEFLNDDDETFPDDYTINSLEGMKLIRDKYMKISKAKDKIKLERLLRNDSLIKDYAEDIYAYLEDNASLVAQYQDRFDPFLRKMEILDVASEELLGLKYEDEEMQEVGCELCTEKALFRCSDCKKTNYCSKECQKKHWKKHEKKCSK